MYIPHYLFYFYFLSPLSANVLLLPTYIHTYMNTLLVYLLIFILLLSLLFIIYSHYIVGLTEYQTEDK